MLNYQSMLLTTILGAAAQILMQKLFTDVWLLDKPASNFTISHLDRACLFKIQNDAVIGQGNLIRMEDTASNEKKWKTCIVFCSKVFVTF